MSYPQAVGVEDIQLALTDSKWDALIIVASSFADIPDSQIKDFIHSIQQIDQRIGKQAVLLPCEFVPGNRLIVAPTDDLTQDYADVRSFAEAASAGVVIAAGAGAKSPLLWVVDGVNESAYRFAAELAYLGCTQALWQPLEAREHFQAAHLENIEPVEQLGIYAANAVDADWLSALEAGRRVARDLCGTEPERMAPPRFADYCVETFEGSAVEVEVEDNIDTLNKEYPMLMAVARASLSVERHHPRVIRLVYQGEGPIDSTLLLAGKGLVYDTGGADLKVGGSMAGMSRDKGGGASVAGFMKTVADLKPKGIKVIAEIGAVRNSIGSDCFVPDEIITSHHGVRVRIGNTDAEGRLVLGDLLSHLRVDALDSPNPQLFSIATLTGHAARSVGPYSALVENGPSRRNQVAQKLADAGDLWGDPSEVSRIRREDYRFIAPKTRADDVRSCNNAASSITSRGHQFPMAFLAISSGIDEHGCKASVSLPYVHIDIAGSGVEGGDWQHGKPTAAAVSMLAAAYLRG